MRMETIGGHAVGFDEGPHRYFIDGVEVPSVTKIIGGGKKTYYAAGAAQRGTDIHELTARIDQGHDIPTDEINAYEGWINAWDAFKRDYQFTLIAAECMGFSLGPLMHAGTIDRIAMITPPGGKEGRAIIDLKSGGKSYDYPIQVSAYERLTTIYDGITDWLALVYLKENGKYSVQMVNKTERVMAFAEFVRRQGVYQHG